MEILTIGGYEQVGKNMTAVKIKDDVFLFDMGLYLPVLVEQEEQDKQLKYTEDRLRSLGAIPNDLVLDKYGWKDKVRAIIIGHAHLDHVGGVPYMAHRYPKADIFGTPFTIEVLEFLLKDEKNSLPNRRRKISLDSSYIVHGKSGDYKVEFITSTHSTLQTSMVALHTPEGIFLYTLDFKFDNHPIIGSPPNYRRLQELGKKGVKAIVVDALYSDNERKTASERVARNMVEDAILSVRDRRSALFVTTFSSHIARIKSIVEFSNKLHRKPVFLGRSLNKYTKCAEQVGLASFRRQAIVCTYKREVNSFLKKLNKNKGQYLIICTGHQAEPGAILDRVSNDETPFRFQSGDNVIFASSVIPTPINIQAREKMDKNLRKKGVRIQTDVHVSGHGGREDLRDLIEYTKPENIIPSHGTIQQISPLIDLASEMGYKLGETSHLSSNGRLLKLI